MTAVDTKTPEDKGPVRYKKRAFTVSLQLFLSLLVLGCGVALAAYYLKTGPEAKPRKRQPSPALVQVAPVHYGSHQLIISAMGPVLAAKEISLTPGVSGEIIAMSDQMVPGGFFAENELLLTIDPIDYQLAVRQLQSEVAQARNDLELEMGNQRIARKEFELLGQKVTEEEKKLMLRLPQLEMKKATLAGVEARLAQAELNQKRARVLAPFNGVVLSRSVNVGTRVSQSTPLARLVGTDEFWIKLAIPTDQLQWIIFPSDKEEGSMVKIFLQQKTNGDPIRLGRVIRLAADIEEQGRMAAVYITVKDPLSLLPENKGKPQLLLGSFIRAEIMGTELSSVVPIDRDHLRENDSIWLMSKDNSLEIRQVDILAKTIDKVFVGSGLKNGDRLIVSALSSPVAGSPLQLLQQTEQDEDKEKTTAQDSRPQKGAIVQ